MPDLPTGTVTFLFTDIEGSTRLIQQAPDLYPGLLEAHQSLIREAFLENDGVEVGTEGDSIFVAFASALKALSAAIAAERALMEHRWPEGMAVRVRMGLHTGEGRLGGDNYVGLDIHRGEQVSDAAHGGQIVVSGTTASLIGSSLRPGVVLRDLGEHRLKDLVDLEHIFQVCAPGLETEFAPLRSLDASVGNLPRYLSTFVGRQEDRTRALDLLRSNRLLTLTGPGGTGKTRLAVQIAEEARHQFRDGAYFVPLAQVTEPTVIAPAVLDALGVHVTSGVEPEQQLEEYLSRRELLLVIDNFEQVLDGGFVVATLLSASPESKFLVTSRAPLRISGEQEMGVPPLDVPNVEGSVPAEDLAGYSSVELFADRARSVRPDFAVTSANAPAVAALAARLDGLPLAIELAAARVKVFSPETILERLDSRLLEGGSRDLPARQRTLRNTIAWSYDLLEESTRRLFAWFGAFAGGVAWPQLEAVCAGELDLYTELTALVDHSLLLHTEVGGESRFVMLELIREFAVERLDESGEAAEARRRHATAYLALADEAHPQLTGPEATRWLHTLNLEARNLHAALDFAIDDGDARLALGLIGSLWRFWHMAGHLHRASERIDAALALHGEFPEARARALEGAGGVAYWRGEGTTEAYYREALAIRRELGGRREIAYALYNLSFPLGAGGDAAGAAALLDESLEISSELGDRKGIGNVYWSYANISLANEDHGRSADYARMAIESFDESDSRDLGWAVFVLGWNLLVLGELDEAESNLVRSLKMFSEVRDLSGVVMHLATFAILAYDLGKVARAARLSAATSALKERTGIGLIETDPVMGRRVAEVEVEARSHPELWSDGEAMSMEEAVEFALAED